MLEYREADGVVELRTRFSAGKRFALALVGLVPLLAPYELLLKPGWTDVRSVAFGVALAVSLGAMSVSGFMVFAAVAGLDRRIVLDGGTRQLLFTQRSPLSVERTRVWAFDAVEAVEVAVNTWSEGPDTYWVRVRMHGGEELSSGSTNSRSDAEHHVAAIRKMIDGACVRR